jgi:hypothetical protein
MNWAEAARDMVQQRLVTSLCNREDANKLTLVCMLVVLSGSKYTLT